MTGMGDVSVLVEEAELDAGVPVVLRAYGGRVRVAVDPAQADIELVEAVLNIYG